MRALLHCLLETGYNKSSEHHEESSWFTESAGVDPRIAAIEEWEKATASDSLFVLDLPWLKTGMTLGQVMDRIFANARVSLPRMTSATDLARLMINNSSAGIAESGGENNGEAAGEIKSLEQLEQDVLGAIIDEIF